jgi:hypothetical protein
VKGARAKRSWRQGEAEEVRREVMRLGVSARKIRLHSVACCRLVARHITNPDCRALIDLIERRADDDTLARDLTDLRRKVKRWADAAVVRGVNRNWYARFSVWASAEPRPRAPVGGFSYERRFRDVLTEVLGPRTGCPAFAPEWRTDTAVALARTMYDSREFGAMPILADALQDAGCDNPDVLNRCREAGATHVRGCWVVDLVLGKE